METAGDRTVPISFICLIETQAKNVFFRLFASAIGEIFVFSDNFKTAFLLALLSTRCCPLLPWRKSADLPQGGASF